MGFLLNIKLLFFLGLETANLTIDKLKKQIQENVTGIQNRHQTGPDLVSITGMYVSFVLPLRENVLNFCNTKSIPIIFSTTLRELFVNCS